MKTLTTVRGLRGWIIPLMAAFFLFLSPLYGQFTGGYEAGTATPAPAKKAELTAGALDGDVNLFSGTLDLTYDFGVVSTLSGLSFPIRLNYTSSAVTSFDPAHNSGIPYGEGWNLTEGFISCDYFGYAIQNTDQNDFTWDPVLQKNRYTKEAMEKEGRVFFSNPTLNLPGYAGRLVYKQPTKNGDGQIYVLQNFSEYVEAVFDGENWTVYLPDGTIYLFSMKQYRERNPTSRMPHADSLLREQIIPKTQIDRWYISEISNPNHAAGQRIVFDYATFGEIDFHTELSQNAVENQLFPESYFYNWTSGLTFVIDSSNLLTYASMGICPGGCNIGDTVNIPATGLQEFHAYRDILLQSVYSTDIEGIVFQKVDLKHRTWDPDTELDGDPRKPVMMNRGKFVEIGDPLSWRLDSLYTAITVYSQGTDDFESKNNILGERPVSIGNSNFTGWGRYQHPFAHENPLFDSAQVISTYSPYFAKYNYSFLNPTSDYLARQNIPVDANPDFSHSVLESPRISLDDLPGGDLYQLRVTIKAHQNADANFDVQLVSGVNPNLNLNQASAVQHETVGGQNVDFIPLSVYDLPDFNNPTEGVDGYEKGYSLFSSFGNPVKWNPIYEEGAGDFFTIGQWFQMPNLPSEFDGVNIQIGPSTDNTNHWESRSDNNGYYQYYNNVDPVDFYIYHNDVDLPTAKFFGTGAPMQPFYVSNRFSVANRTSYYAQFSVEKGVRGRRFLYWHVPNWSSYNVSQVNAYGANQPTAVTKELLNGNQGSFSSILRTSSNFSSFHDTYDSELWSVELVRVSKNPWMLDSVVFYQHREEYGQNLTVTAAFNLEYELDQVPVLNNVNDWANNPLPQNQVYKYDGQDYYYRNIWHLAQVERLPIDPVANKAYKNPSQEVPTTHFAYFDTDTTTPFIEESYLIQYVWNELGGKTEYEYYPTVDTIEIGDTKVPYNSNGQVRYTFIGAGKIKRQDFKVQYKHLETEQGQQTWEYAYENPVQMYKYFTLDNHFAHGGAAHRTTAPHKGHKKAILKRPSPDGLPIDVRTETEFFTDLNSPADSMLFGKVKQVMEYDTATSWISRQTTTYSVTKAFKSKYHFDPVGPLHVPFDTEWMPSPHNLIYPYDGTYLNNGPGNSPGTSWRNESWFVRVTQSESEVRDPETGNIIKSTTHYTHYDWDENLSDPDGDYATLYNDPLGATGLDPVYFDSQNDEFTYGKEPSWQVATITTSNDAMPGAYNKERMVYLWDVGPMLEANPDPNFYSNTFRPFFLAGRYKIRSLPVESRSEVYNGDPNEQPFAKSMYYWYKTPRNVAGNFETIIDSTNAGNICMGGGNGSGFFTGDMQVIAYCFDEGSPKKLVDVTAEILDDPRYVQDTIGNWWFFPIAGLEVVSLDDAAAMADFSPDSLSGSCSSGVLLDQDSKPKYFGTFTLTTGGTLEATAIQAADRNFGKEVLAGDSLTEYSLKKSGLICHVPYVCGPDSICHIVCDSSLSLIIDPDTTTPSPYYLNLGDVLANQFFLEAVYAQADTILNSRIDGCVDQATVAPPGNPSRLSLHDNFTVEPTGSTRPGEEYEFYFRPNFATIRVHKVHEWNYYGQVIDQSNSRRLHTIYEYSHGTEHISFDSCGNRLSDVTRPFVGMPLSVTVTDLQGDIEEVTIFEYNDDYTVKRITSPNTEISTFDFDDYGRLAEFYKNGNLLETYNYQQWQNNRQLTFAQKTQENFVKVVTHDGQHQGQEMVGVAWNDPLGRLDQAVTAVQYPTGWQKQFAPRSRYDNWGRIVSGYQPYAKQNQSSLGYDPIFPATDSVQTLYERDSRSRVLKSATFGNSLSGTHTSENEQEIITLTDFQTETGASSAEIEQIFPYLTTPGVPVGALYSVIKIHKAKGTDPDGKSGVSYSDAFGRPIASLGWTDVSQSNASRVLTLSVHDVAGNVSKIIHPNKLETTRRHNVLGWAYQSITPDAGKTKTLYTQAGDIKAIQDANMAKKSKMVIYEMDKMGRIVEETETDVPTAYLDGFILPHGGYSPGTNRGLLDWDSPGFRSINTVYEEVDPEDLLDEDTNIDLGAGECSFLASFSRQDFTLTGTRTLTQFRYDEPYGVNQGEINITVDPNLIPLRVKQRAQAQARMVGRLGLVKRFDEFGQLQMLEFFSYDEFGNTAWEMKQFNPNGITAGKPGRVDFVWYPSYDLQGKLLTVNVDANMDYHLDLQQHYEYDPFGRLEKVFASDVDVEDQGTLIADYTYDDATGKLLKTRHWIWSDTCQKYAVADSIEYTYDHQYRLTGISSELMTYDLFYDGNTPNPGGISTAKDVQFHNNWNGNINGWKVKYNVGSWGVTGFNETTRYGFQYDGLNRLTQADATVEENIINLFGSSFDSGTQTGAGFPSNVTKAWYGDALYEYDLMGNLTGLRRYTYHGPGARPTYDGENWSYQYYTGTNRLEKLTGQVSPTVSFTYDDNGNLTSDSERGLSAFSYDQGNLPLKFTKANGDAVKYVYGGDAGRVYRETTEATGKITSEYHLRDVSGKTLGVLDIEDQEWEFFLYGNGLTAEWVVRDTIIEDDDSTGGGSGPGGNPTNKVFLNQHQQMRFNQAVRASLMMAPTLIPVAFEVAEGGAGMYALPVALVASPFLNELAWKLENRAQSALAEPVPDPRALSPNQTSDDDTLICNVKFFVTDHLGNTRVTYVPYLGTDPKTGAKCQVRYFIESVIDFYPYGKELRGFYANGGERYQSTGHERDVESGFDYRGARYYDSQYGRFLAVDPLAGVQLNLSPYGYVNGNPIRLIDPDGRMATGGGGRRARRRGRRPRRPGYRSPSSTTDISDANDLLEIELARTIHRLRGGNGETFNEQLEVHRNQMIRQWSSTGNVAPPEVRTTRLGEGRTGESWRGRSSFEEQLFEAEAERLSVDPANSESSVENWETPPETGVHIEIKMRENWNEGQRAEATEKARALTDGATYVTRNYVRRSGTRSRFIREGGNVEPGQDVDHTVELQLGGVDELSNMAPLNRSVNRSFGSQIRHAIRNLPNGTKIGTITIK